MKAYALDSPSRGIRILTINVWTGLTYKGFLRIGEYPNDPNKRYELLVREIRSLDPDIIAIQEANPLPYYAKRIATDLGYQVVYRAALGGIRLGPIGFPTNLREGGAILVKKPWTLGNPRHKRLGGRGVVTNWFSFHLGEITQVLLIRAIINGKPLHIYAVHLHGGLFQGTAFDKALEQISRELPRGAVEQAKQHAKEDTERRRLEIANLIAFVKQTLPPDMPAVILGDFNTTVESGDLAPLLVEQKWVDSYQFKNPGMEGMTWDPFSNPNFREEKELSKPYDRLHAYHDRYPCRIDFILLNPNFPSDWILDSRVVMKPVDGLSSSDHYGVLTTLKW